MSTAQNKKPSEKKRKKGSRTEVDTTSSDMSTKSVEQEEGTQRCRDSTPHKRSKPSVSRDRQTKLTFQTTTLNDVVEKLEKLQSTTEALQESVETSRSSLSNKLDEKIETLTAMLFDLQQENVQLKKALEVTEKQSKDMKEEVSQLKSTIQEQTETLNELEQYSRRETVRVHGVQGDRKEETNEECERKVLQIFRSKLGITVSSDKISALHRVGKPMEGKPRPVLVKLISRKDKVSIVKERKKLKGSPVVITDDLTRLNVQRLNRVRQHEGVLNAWSAAGGRIFAKLLDTTVREIVRGDTTIIDRVLIGSSSDDHHRRRQQQQQPKSRRNNERFRPNDHSTPLSKQFAPNSVADDATQL